MKETKRILAGLLTAVLLLTTILPMTVWAGEPTWQEALDGSSEYLSENVALTYGSDGDWSTFALARNLDTDIADDTYDFAGYYYSVEKAYNDNQVSSAGDCARTLLALNAIGRGETELARNIGNKLYDLETAAGTEAYKSDSFQTSANAIQALQNVQADSIGTVRSNILGYLLTNENAAHYWDYTYGADWGGDADTTAAIITAYHEEKPSGTETDQARAWLASKIDEAGTINTGWGGSASSTAMALIAFAEQGIVDVTTKSGSDKTTVDGLISFYDNDTKAFSGWDGSPNVMATYQANYALVAYDRSQTAGAASLFDISDVTAVYYISFDGSGASNTMKVQSIKSGDPENLNANTLINRGYRFVGWKDAEGNTYTNKQAVTASSDITLYAIWERIVSNAATSDNAPKINLNGFYEDAMRVDSYNAVHGDWKLNDSGKWTFFIDGIQVKGSWVKAINPAAGENKAGRYYFDASGEMLTGWQKIKGEDGVDRWYYFNPHPDPWFGACYIDTVTPDGYAVDSNGAWMDPSIVPEEEIAKVTEKADESAAGTSASSGDASSESKKAEKKITVSVSVNGNTVSGSDEVTLNKNASAFDALKSLCKKMGWTVSGSGSYVKGIGGEMEKSAGAQSGWTYSVNGKTPNKSAGSYKLKDGDSVDWIFVYEPDY